MKNIKIICTIFALLAVNSIVVPKVLAQTKLSDFSSVVENPVEGKEVTLRGKIIESIEDCYVFTDGTNKILVHFEDEEYSYDPNTEVEISGIVQEHTSHDGEHFEAGNHDHDHDHEDISMDTMIMVNEIQVITANE